MLASLDYATRGLVVRKALEMDDEYRWKRFDFDEHSHLLVRFAGAQARWLDLHKVRL
jgi:hypothetical protein